MHTPHFPEPSSPQSWVWAQPQGMVGSAGCREMCVPPTCRVRWTRAPTGCQAVLSTVLTTGKATKTARGWATSASGTLSLPVEVSL